MIARTSLITLIFLSPTPVMMTENSVCSSTGRRFSSSSARHCGHGDRGGGANAESLLEFLYEFAEVENRHTLDEINNFLFCNSHSKILHVSS